MLMSKVLNNRFFSNMPQYGESNYLDGIQDGEIEIQFMKNGNMITRIEDPELKKENVFEMNTAYKIRDRKLIFSYLDSVIKKKSIFVVYLEALTDDEIIVRFNFMDLVKFYRANGTNLVPESGKMVIKLKVTVRRTAFPLNPLTAMPSNVAAHSIMLVPIYIMEYSVPDSHMNALLNDPISVIA